MRKDRYNQHKNIHEEIMELVDSFIPLDPDKIIALERLLTELYERKDSKSLEYYLSYLERHTFVDYWKENVKVMTPASVESVKIIYEYVEKYLDYLARSTYLVLFSLVVGQCTNIEYIVYLSNIDGIRDDSWKGSDLSHALALSAVANGYNKLGFAHEAYTFALQAVTAARKCGDPSILAPVTHTLAIVAYEAHDYEEAEQWYYEAMNWAIQQQDTLRVAKIKLNLAKLLYFTKQSFTQALDLLLEAKEIFEINNDMFLVQDCYCELGQVHTYLRHKEEALTAAELSINLARELQSYRSLIYSLCNSAYVYTQFDMMDKSLPPLSEAVELLKHHPYPVFERKAYYLLYQIHFGLENYKQAYEYLHSYMEVMNLLKDEAATIAAKRYKAVFELEKANYENQLLRVKSEKLEQELEYKSKELTALALQIAQKNEVLNVLLQTIDNSQSLEITNVNSLRSHIVNSMNVGKSWEHFEKQFKLVHFDFIERLSRLYPNLSPGELKVCALMKINLTTKEMSNILCQSERSIETYRYRIRKKLHLSGDKNLVSYLSGL